MCGICGFTGQIVDRNETIKNMTDVITHRGPDSDGLSRMIIFQWASVDCLLLT